MTRSERDTRVLVWTSESGSYHDDNYLILKTAMVYIEPGGDLRNYLTDDAMGSIGVRGQMDKSTVATRNYDADFYGTDVQVSDFTGPLHQIERTVKELRRITKSMERHAERFGYPADTTDLLVRMAIGAGVTNKAPFIRRLDSRSWSNDESTYTTMTANDLRYHLRRATREWIDKHNPVAVAS